MSRTAPFIAASESQDGAAAATHEDRLDLRGQLSTALFDAENLGAVNAAQEKFLPLANELERQQVIDRCETRKKQIKAGRGGGSK